MAVGRLFSFACISILGIAIGDSEPFGSQKFLSQSVSRAKGDINTTGKPTTAEPSEALRAAAPTPNGTDTLPPSLSGCSDKQKSAADVATSCSGRADGSAGGCPCCDKSVSSLVGQDKLANVNPAWGRIHISLPSGCFDKVKKYVDEKENGGHLTMTFNHMVFGSDKSCYVYYPVKTCRNAKGHPCPKDSCFKWGGDKMKDVKNHYWHVTVKRSWATGTHDPHLHTVIWKPESWTVDTPDCLNKKQCTACKPR